MAAAVVLSAGSDFIGENSLFDEPQQQFTTYASQSLSAPFDNNGTTFGNVAVATIPKKDDVIRSIYFKSTLGPLHSPEGNGYVFPAYAADIDITIGTIALDTIYVGNQIVSFYNTQQIDAWLTHIDYDLIVSVVGDRFVFSNMPDGVGFSTEAQAAFWGFDISRGVLNTVDIGGGVLVSWYTFQLSDQILNFEQSGWVKGFIPPSINSGYNDSVGDLLIKNCSLLIGGQTIQTFTSNVLLIDDDINVPLENQAGLTITVGRNDTSSPTTDRTYWTRLELDPIHIGTVYNQSVQIKTEFEKFENLTSRSTLGGLLNSSAYTRIGTLPFPYLFLVYKNILIVKTNGIYNGTFTNYNIVTKTFTPVNFGVDIPDVVIRGNTMYGIHFAGTNQQYRVTISLDDNGIIPSSAVFDSYNFCTVLDDFLTIRLIGEQSQVMIGYHNVILWDGGTWWPFVTPLGVFGTTAVSTGNYIYIVCADYSLLKISLNLYTLDRLELSTITTPLNTNLSATYPPISDGKNLYFPANLDASFSVMSIADETWRRFTPNTPLTVSTDVNSPPTPIAFDGRNIIYAGDRGIAFYDLPETLLIFYDTTKSFTSLDAWSWMLIHTDTGLTVSSDGSHGNGINYIQIGNGLPLIKLENDNYLYGVDFTTQSFYTIDPYKVVPKLQSELVVEYSKMLEPIRESTTLVNQNQLNTFTMRAGNIKDVFSLTFTGPVRELWIQSNVTIARIVLELNGEVLIDEDYKSLGILRPFKDHRITPSNPFYSYSISLDPNILEPLGTLNISRIAYPTIQFEFNQTYNTDQTILVYSRSVNVLECQGGIGGLLYN